MINDIIVTKWEYTVYFKREDGATRLVFAFDSMAEAKTCAGKIIKDLGLEAWVKTDTQLHVYP